MVGKKPSSVMLLPVDAGWQQREMELRRWQEVSKNAPDVDCRHILTTNYTPCSAKLIVQILGVGSGPSNILVFAF